MYAWTYRFDHTAWRLHMSMLLLVTPVVLVWGAWNSNYFIIAKPIIMRIYFFPLLFISWKMTSFGELRQRLLHPYYVLHFVYGVVYVVGRIHQLIKGQTISFEASIWDRYSTIKIIADWQNPQETEPKTFLILFGMSTWKCFMAATAEELSSVLILYTKFFTVCSLFWRFGFWYSCLYAVGWIGNLMMFYIRRCICWWYSL